MVSVPSCFSRVRLFAILWTVARRAPPSVGFPRQEYCSESPCPPPGDLPDPGIKPTPPASPALADRFFTTEPSGNISCTQTYMPVFHVYKHIYFMYMNIYVT